MNLYWIAFVVTRSHSLPLNCRRWTVQRRNHRQTNDRKYGSIPKSIAKWSDHRSHTVSRNRTVSWRHSFLHTPRGMRSAVRNSAIWMLGECSNMSECLRICWNMWEYVQICSNTFAETDCRKQNKKNKNCPNNKIFCTRSVLREFPVLFRLNWLVANQFGVLLEKLPRFCHNFQTQTTLSTPSWRPIKWILSDSSAAQSLSCNRPVQVRRSNFSCAVFSFAQLSIQFSIQFSIQLYSVLFKPIHLLYSVLLHFFLLNPAQLYSALFNFIQIDSLRKLSTAIW